MTKVLRYVVLLPTRNVHFPLADRTAMTDLSPWSTENVISFETLSSYHLVKDRNELLHLTSRALASFTGGKKKNLENEGRLVYMGLTNQGRFASRNWGEANDQE